MDGIEAARAWDKIHAHEYLEMRMTVSGDSKTGGRMMDFYSRAVWMRDPTCECYMMNLASNLWFLMPTPPDWSKQ